MAATQNKTAETDHSGPGFLFAIVAGLFFFIAIVKFGVPVILDKIVTPPEDAVAAVFETWQIKWAYRFMLPLIAAGLIAVRWNKLNFKWPLALPLIWLAWQSIAASQTVSQDLTGPTLEYFCACVVLFYLGYFSMQGVRQRWPLWAALGLALCWVMRMGLEQHFGGLEATRRMVFQTHSAASLPPDYLARITSNRIFATFSNPDAFAGCILLLMPVTLVFLWQLTPKVRTSVRRAFVVILGGCGLACLYWSGSKGGWLVTLLVGVIALGHSTLALKWKRILICGVLILGVAAFGVRYAGFFKKERNSVGARFAYWHAAAKIIAAHPLLGTGPGTFSVPYKQFKQPDDEMTQLCHNDYLEQATDSGLPGFVAYMAMIVGFLAYLYRYRIRGGFTLGFAVWLGLLGLCLHSIVEYHLYIPALAWPMFFLVGNSLNLKD